MCRSGYQATTRMPWSIYIKLPLDHYSISDSTTRTKTYTYRLPILKISCLLLGKVYFRSFLTNKPSLYDSIADKNSETSNKTSKFNITVFSIRAGSDNNGTSYSEFDLQSDWWNKGCILLSVGIDGKNTIGLLTILFFLVNIQHSMMQPLGPCCGQGFKLP